MSQIDLYAVLRGLGVEEEKAKAAVGMDATAATKADLAELKSSLIMWMIGIQIGVNGVLVALIGLLLRAR